MKTNLRGLSVLAVLSVLGALGAGPAWAQQSVLNVLTRGTTPYHLIAANTNNSTLVRAAPTVLVSVQLSGVGAAPAYVKFYDKATAPTCGTDVPKKVLAIPAASTAANGGGSNVTVSLGTGFALGLGFCVVTGIADNDNTAVAAATFNVNFDYAPR